MTVDKLVGLLWYGAAILTLIVVVAAIVLDALEIIDL